MPARLTPVVTGHPFRSLAAVLGVLAAPALTGGLPAASAVAAPPEAPVVPAPGPATPGPVTPGPVTPGPVTPGPPTGLPTPVAFRPPVEGPVIDPFRPPPTPYSAGNRGVDYATTPGQPVGATAAGLVTFAGQVGGTLNVVLLHGDGIRTSYSLLASVSVVAGQRVAAGQTVGTAGTDLHLGARAGDAYVDPQLLFGDGSPAVRLVPDRPPPAASSTAGNDSRLPPGPVGAPVAAWLQAGAVAPGPAPR